jgi:dephospho-CoA kinase
MPPQHLIGLTGPVGAGKSTVLAWLGERGAAVLDADTAVHDLLATDEATIAEVADLFGDAVIANGRVDRGALGRRVFDNPEALSALETAVHPAVDRWIDDWLAERTEAVAVVEGVKLVEAGMHRRCDEVWLVACDLSVRKARLARRGWDDAEIRRRVASAPPLGPELVAARRVIDNSGAWRHTARQLEAAWAATRTAWEAT